MHSRCYCRATLFEMPHTRCSESHQSSFIVNQTIYSSTEWVRFEVVPTGDIVSEQNTLLIVQMSGWVSLGGHENGNSSIQNNATKITRKDIPKCYYHRKNGSNAVIMKLAFSCHWMYHYMAGKGATGPTNRSPHPLPAKPKKREKNCSVLRWKAWWFPKIIGQL